MTVYDYSIKQLCEIAYLAGALQNEGAIKLPDGDIEEMFDNVYSPILEEWSNGKTIAGTFQNEEEEGYIGVFAQRRLQELYPVPQLQTITKEEFYNDVVRGFFNDKRSIDKDG